MDDGQRSFFGLSRSPFGPVTATSDFFRSFYLGGLIDGVTAAVTDGRAVAAIQGAHGVGKTSIMPALATALQRSGCVTALIDGVSASPRLLQRVLGEAAGCEAPDPEPGAILQSWRSTGRRPRIVLLVDDAEALSPSCCLYLWQMIELCQAQSFGLHLVLLGDLGPWSGLEDPALAAMREAAFPRFMIRCLNQHEAPQYLDHRLRQAGGSLRGVMTRAATAELLDRTGCNPDHLNAAATRALAVGYRAGRRRVDARVLRQALSPGQAGLRGGTIGGRTVRWGAMTVAAALVIVFAGVAGWRTAAMRVQPAARRAAVAATPRVMAIPFPPAEVAAGLVPPPVTSHPAAGAMAMPGLATDGAHSAGLAKVEAAEGTRMSSDATRQAVAGAGSAAAGPASPSTPTRVATAAPKSAVDAGTTRNARAQTSSGVALAPVPMSATQSGPGLVLVASPGDTMARLYRRVYRGLVPPSYLTKAAADTRPITPGSLVVFPAPAQGWVR